ncbi:hypothetical protein BDV41DRAFT_573863 [Aspergillus transmontanensis]|uniref:Uncharacterized protein n=1 Tax=Aspergillus transmontanensis TaxID=1034304 RepID=A0A5N6W9T7_9EURO|nr:hypothetical protein BDV41DRAFT_573863 [Aspergillus transmontanensis]
MKKANERAREMEFQERPVVLQLLIARLRERGSPVSEWKRYHDGVDSCYPALAVTLRKVLYNNGSDVIARLNKESLPTLCHAVIFDYWEVVEFLMNNSVDPNQTDGTLSILQYMAKCGSERSAQLLIVAGADVHAVDKNGYSVIYCAVTVISGNGPAIIDLLLTNGVNANAKFGPKWQQHFTMRQNMGTPPSYNSCFPEGLLEMQLIVQERRHWTGQNGSTVKQLLTY